MLLQRVCGRPRLTFQKMCARNTLLHRHHCALHTTSIPHCYLSCHSRLHKPLSSQPGFSCNYRGVCWTSTSKSKNKSYSIMFSPFITLLVEQSYPISAVVRHAERWCGLVGQRRGLHSSVVWRQDVPDYLEGLISQVAQPEDHLLLEVDNDMEREQQTLENDIIDFFQSQLIAWEEAETCFIIQCPTCFTTHCTSHTQEIYVDKHTGYFVCPWCNQDGTWEELMVLLSLREDTLTVDQLSTFLASTLHITQVGEHILQYSPLKEVSRATLAHFDARVTSDECRLILPVHSSEGQLVGIESVSLLHAVPQVMRRYLVGQSHAFCHAGRSRWVQRVLVVPSCCDVLALAEHRVNAFSLPLENVKSLESLLLSLGKIEVVLWWCGQPPPRPLLNTLTNAGVTCSIIQSPSGDTPVHQKSAIEVEAALKKTIPLLSETITAFPQLKDQIYHRLTHKEETCGVQWSRFTELNDIMLGHRTGEMTVLTGATGSGKTTLMAEYSLDLCSQGVITVWGSFEISVVRLCEVMLQQFNGAPLPQDLTLFNTLASQFSVLPLHFLTYHGQQCVTSVIKALSESVSVWGVKHVVIDNLQFMLGTSEQTHDRWWEQDRAVAAFRRFATQHNCHVTLIVHPKKIPDGQPLGIDSVFGGARVTQEADNVLILQNIAGSPLSQPRKKLQVVKNRYGGQLGALPLRFHKESLTLSSYFHRRHKEGASEAKTEDTKRKSSLRKVRFGEILGI